MTLILKYDPDIAEMSLRTTIEVYRSKLSKVESELDRQTRRQTRLEIAVASGNKRRG